jgi:glycosyltransferase involved in cell wall biosynthesis
MSVVVCGLVCGFQTRSSHFQDYQMDFSIITPSYNYGRYIRDCLGSVAAQDGVSFEHLVMDACSTDDSASIVEEFPHATLFQEPDEGMTDAINKGFLLAKGEWVMWLNADDMLEKGALAAVREFARHHPASDLIYGTYRFIDAGGRTIRLMKLLDYSRFISMHHGCYVPSTATFLRRSTTIGQGHLPDIRMRLVMDNEYYARLSLAGKKLTYSPKSLARFRIHDQNLSSIGGIERGGLTTELSYARKRAESEAVRRTYGWTFSGNIMLTHAVDYLLYLSARLLKGAMKLRYYFRTDS